MAPTPWSRVDITIFWPFFGRICHTPQDVSRPIVDQYHQIFHCKPHMIFIPHERFEDDNPTVQYWGGIRWVFISVMNLQSGHQIWCQTPNLVPWGKSRFILHYYISFALHLHFIYISHSFPE